MDNLPDWVKTAGLLLGLPLYGYILIRITVSGIVRSYYEIKYEFQRKGKETV
jgi:hypothetical protein